MDWFRNIYKNSYYRIRIIFSFTIFTVILVVIISRAGYVFLRNLYLNQLTEQVNIVTQMLTKQIDPKYLDLLPLGTPTKSTENIFRGIFLKNLKSGLHSEIFIFGKDDKIVVHSDSLILYGTIDPRLMLNQKEISALKVGESTASMPFKGDDGKWYLWGFYRVKDDYWLAVRESAARLQKVEDFSIMFWYFGFGGIVLAIILGLLMARSITKPVDKLVKFSSEIGKGNFHADVPKGMHGEIELLSNAMDQMRNDISTHQKEKEELLAQIAHEIRNPLGGIELLASLTKEELEGESKKTDYLDKILKEVNGLENLISSYLNYSRPMSANPKWINLPEMVKGLNEILNGSLKKKNVNLITDIKLNKIYYDENHLREILLNLIRNSLDSIECDGEVIISASEKKSSWEISIKDNGAGISKENLNKIFNPFFTTKKNGTGLGLAICKKLSTENKSTLTAASNPKSGTTFILTNMVKEGRGVN
ncbi:MAG: ATP-binding protein [Bacteroidetes bacterium]|nr:ATP-binding protein [Bacteroidota bacterium]